MAETHGPDERAGITAKDKEPSGAQKMFGDFAPALVHFTDEVLFGQVWTRQELSPKDRSLVTDERRAIKSLLRP